jgi:hypothetical protein
VSEDNTASVREQARLQGEAQQRIDATRHPNEIGAAP